MIKLTNVEKIVTGILEDVPETRDSDDVLYFTIVSKWADRGLSARDILVDRSAWGLPPYESVRRTRQKVQSKREDLRGSRRARQDRCRKEEEYRAYAVE